MNSDAEVWHSFEVLQEELNYRQAQDSLRHLLKNIDLSPRESSGLEEQLLHLTHLLEKLDQSIVQIAVFGLVGRGKSSVLNALLGEDVFQVGPLHGVTRTIGTATWQVHKISGGGNSYIELIDTPGIDEVEGKVREILAQQIARRADLLLFVTAGDLTQVEYQALCELREVGKPMILVFNKVDQYPEVDRTAIYNKLKNERLRQLLSPDEIVMVAAAPLVVEAVKLRDGTIKTQRHRGQPQVEALKLKILEILHREGKSLVALNTMLYANEVNEQMVARKLSIREEAAQELLWRSVIIKSMAVAFNPVTVLDLFTGCIIDVAMILAFSHLYGIPMTQTAALGLLQKIAITMGGISASEVLASLGLGSLKSILTVSAPVTMGASLAPYISVAIAQAGVAGLSSYAIGQITKAYLANGASWGPEGPKSVVAKILQSIDEASIIHRIKEELTSKLGSISPQTSGL